MSSLGSLYNNGHGVPRDLASHACDEDVTRACGALVEVYSTGVGDAK